MTRAARALGGIRSLGLLDVWLGGLCFCGRREGRAGLGLPARGARVRFPALPGSRESGRFITSR